MALRIDEVTGEVITPPAENRTEPDRPRHPSPEREARRLRELLERRQYRERRVRAD